MDNLGAIPLGYSTSPTYLANIPCLIKFIYRNSGRRSCRKDALFVFNFGKLVPSLVKYVH